MLIITNCQLSTVNCQLRGQARGTAPTTRQLSTVNCQLRGQARTIHCPYHTSTVNCQLSTD
ncbi:MULTISPECIES: hypothetical protein [unclassified Microcoleus]|uniref:hypothetical protein n=1 Tax=unclassified Microcoleus TaxID=2642155 RepID=UPI0025E73BC5|nr:MULTISPECIES: hypothetical protein [unclassified Microcoleus]